MMVTRSVSKLSTHPCRGLFLQVRKQKGSRILVIPKLHNCTGYSRES